VRYLEHYANTWDLNWPGKKSKAESKVNENGSKNYTFTFVYRSGMWFSLVESRRFKTPCPYVDGANYREISHAP